MQSGGGTFGNLTTTREYIRDGNSWDLHKKT